MHQDPTRIPSIIQLLQQAWEAQPDEPLATIWGQLEMKGIGWGSTDDNVVAALKELLRMRPASIHNTNLTTSLAVIDTEAPKRRISIDGLTNRMTIRAFEKDIKPVSFKGFSLERAQVSAPLLVKDSDEISHRFGVIISITVNEVSSNRNFSGLAKEDLNQRVIGVVTGNGDFLIISSKITGYFRDDMGVQRKQYEWDKLLQVEVGSALVFHRGGADVGLGEVADVFYIEG